ncbi:hypothetical protein [Natronobiforma cellulositropha]|uniref:hypothetical protein n=1 Tax=Natronobiforma cellulositropha TaxID=1679076 RepID=UPI0021D5B05B|nr:hypothetical protein [Natronobiforma cellulositropha]
MSQLVRTVRRRIRDEHGSVVYGVERCADAVVHAWETPTQTDAAAITDPLRARLESTGVLAALPLVLADLVDSAGCTLPASPVAAPPYVVVTSRGPILRATIDPGRLVVRFDTFDVERDPQPRYRRLEGVRVVVSLE